MNSGANKLSSYVALLRGINVGGKNMLPMKDLAAMFVEAGCAEVLTYIQSGNVVFKAPPDSCPKTAESIEEIITVRFGFRVPIILRTSQQIAHVLRENPFHKTGVEEKMLHVYFLSSAPDAAAIGRLDPQRCPPDEFRVFGQHIYLHLPHGMGRTKLTNAYFDSKLSTTSTARNWATIKKIADLMRA